MKAESVMMSRVFSSGGEIHYVMPYFQREYAWQEENWRLLLTDVIDTCSEYVSDDDPPEHFLGALVVIGDGMRHGVMPAFKLVDGQQRLISVSLILCALGRLIRGSHPVLHSRIRKLLTNADIDGLFRFKLLPTTKYGDQETYQALIDDRELPDKDSGIQPAFKFFYGELERKIRGGLDPDLLLKVLINCLQVVLIDLDKRERPYEIFESLNAKSKPLSQADLVRNYIAMALPEGQQEQVFEEHWARVEERLQEKRKVGHSGIGELTAFLRHYLSLRSRVLCNEGHVYARFRSRMEADFSDPSDFANEIGVLARFVSYYNRILRPSAEPDDHVRERLVRLNRMETTTAYPFLLALYDAR